MDHEGEVLEVFATKHRDRGSLPVSASLRPGVEGVHAVRLSSDYGTVKCVQGIGCGPPPVLLMAEGVEKVRTIKFCVTIVRANRACCNIYSTKPRILKHCFKNFERPDFFNMA